MNTTEIDEFWKLMRECEEARMQLYENLFTALGEMTRHRIERTETQVRLQIERGTR